MEFADHIHAESDLILKQQKSPMFYQPIGKLSKVDNRKWWCPEPYESECENDLIGLHVCEYDALRSLKKGKIIVSQLCCKVVREIDQNCVFKIFFKRIHLLPYFKRYCTHTKSSPPSPTPQGVTIPPPPPLPPAEQPPTPLKPIAPSPSTPIEPPTTTPSPSQGAPQPTIFPPSPISSPTPLGPSPSYDEPMVPSSPEQGQSPTRLPQAPEGQGPSTSPPTAGPGIGFAPAPSSSPLGGCTCVCPPTNK